MATPPPLQAVQAPLTKAARQAAIVELLESRAVASQTQLGHARQGLGSFDPEPGEGLGPAVGGAAQRGGLAPGSGQRLLAPGDRPGARGDIGRGEQGVAAAPVGDEPVRVGLHMGAGHWDVQHAHRTEPGLVALTVGGLRRHDHDVVSRPGQGQAELLRPGVTVDRRMSEEDHTGSALGHEPASVRSMVRPVRADSMHASATRTVARPCSIVTMSASLPRTASRKFSCSTRSGSGLAMA